MKKFVAMLLQFYVKNYFYRLRKVIKVTYFSNVLLPVAINIILCFIHLDGISFYQVSSQVALIPNSQLSFNNLKLIRSSPKENYNIATSTFTILKTGLYWFHLSAGIPAGKQANYKINGLDYIIGILKNNTAYSDDQVTVDGLAWVRSGATLNVSTDNDLFSSQYEETSWSWFRLDDAMKHLVAFYVSNINKSGSLAEGNLMTYDKVIVNDGNGWNSNLNVFNAPVNGFYFLSVGIATIKEKISCVELTVNNTVVVQKVCIYETKHNGNELARASKMMLLRTGDIVSCIVRTSFYFGNASCLYYSQVYLQGFLYEPLNEKRKIAWSVSRSLSKIWGAVDYVAFDIVYVNEGNSWNPTTNSARIPQRGVYLIDLSTYLCGAPGNGNENVQVMLNNDVVIQLRLNATGLNDCISRSRSSMLQLQAGDSLRIRIPTHGSCYVSYSKIHHSFTGFLLYSLE